MTENSIAAASPIGPSIPIAQSTWATSRRASGSEVHEVKTTKLTEDPASSKIFPRRTPRHAILRHRSTMPTFPDHFSQLAARRTRSPGTSAAATVSSRWRWRPGSGA
jgi:hypothetical protein